MEELLSAIQISHLLRSHEGGKRAQTECKNEGASEKHPNSEGRNWHEMSQGLRLSSNVNRGIARSLFF